VPRSLGFRNLLVPVSDNEESERAMDVACRLAADHGATIVALHVIEVPPVLPLDAHMTAEDAAAHRLLGRAAAVADTYGVHVLPRVLRARDASRAIVTKAEERRAEIVVIGAPRKRRMRRAAFGSTVEHVLKHAPCRVMVIGAAQGEASIAQTAAA
jgi:nucleotide-binding universal stress UspA family protein